MDRNETAVWPERGAPARPEISPEIIEAAMIRGRKLRAQQAVYLASTAVSLVRRAFTRLRSTAPQARHGTPDPLRGAS